MKFHSIVSAVAGIAVCTTAATAQVCQGDLSFRGSQKHVGAALGLSNNSTSFGGGLSLGHSKGWFGGGSLGMASYDNISAHSVALGGAVGYAMPLAKGSQWQMCPGATLSLGFGPNFDAGGTTAHTTTQTLALGVSVGTAVKMSKSVNVLPFGSAALGHTRVAVSANGNSGSADDSYLVLGMGAGFQFSPNLVVSPALNLLAGTEPGTDDTIFSLGITWAIGR
ncbi:MAG TPA: outer membrane beta-barrel protein [Gemmatimonadaceae bacterium]|nr:outer membrane beta-barrel protein [Gemmatimonadaceae bacterium]